jgi:hypothetical protein
MGNLIREIITKEKSLEITTEYILKENVGSKETGLVPCVTYSEGSTKANCCGRCNSGEHKWSRSEDTC